MNAQLSPQAMTAASRLARGLSQELKRPIRLSDPQLVETLLRLSRGVRNPDLQSLRLDLQKAVLVHRAAKRTH